ncbi:MAG: hypothetical protein HN846_02260 [Candidatus Pacebacteria bacterium]|jgi:hypothetical protein|nr:hypothetical protein [Candidatus Paceibacterota bacterium]MBT3512344.1 hypothetical protein [Candidatus Paceibacterota bacterium]MBT4005032.1 hypothetical protein [Candidatus Paceibacterota bacterium]MBT4358807.1 hypothetical protein [Candidatus Paceibacterota bacterium]MBT4680444.1 hypothetical protein [Candidatus Paceibacterota bacterium]
MKLNKYIALSLITVATLVMAKPVLAAEEPAAEEDCKKEENQDKYPGFRCNPSNGQWQEIPAPATIPSATAAPAAREEESAAPAAETDTFDNPKPLREA